MHEVNVVDWKSEANQVGHVTEVEEKELTILFRGSTYLSGKGVKASSKT